MSRNHCKGGGSIQQIFTWEGTHVLIPNGLVLWCWYLILLTFYRALRLLPQFMGGVKVIYIQQKCIIYNHPGSFIECTQHSIEPLNLLKYSSKPNDILIECGHRDLLIWFSNSNFCFYLKVGNMLPYTFTPVVVTNSQQCWSTRNH